MPRATVPRPLAPRRAYLAPLAAAQLEEWVERHILVAPDSLVTAAHRLAASAAVLMTQVPFPTYYLGQLVIRLIRSIATSMLYHTSTLKLPNPFPPAVSATTTGA